MLGDAKKRRSANPQRVLRHLAGLKNDSPVGFLPVIPSNPKAQHALYDLRAIALRYLDMDFLTAIRPSQSDPAYMLDAATDVIGYAAFVQSRYRDYVGIHNNLGALHDYLLNTPEPEIVNYDLQAFLITLRAAREAMPALAATTAALEPLLTEERIFRLSVRPPEHAKLLRRIYSARRQFAEFFDEFVRQQGVTTFDRRRQFLGDLFGGHRRTVGRFLRGDSRRIGVEGCVLAFPVRGRLHSTGAGPIAVALV